jgi:hypothetical protein
MNELIFAGSSAALMAGLIYFRTGRGPLRQVVFLILHIQAAIPCAAEAARVAARRFRDRYPEYLAEAARSYQ